MKYEDACFLRDLKDYLVNDINKICIFINNEIEYICYNFDNIFNIVQDVNYDKLNISISTTSTANEYNVLNLYFTKKRGERR